MKTIYLIQHPQSEHHVNGMVGSQTDWPLSAKGLIQARTIAKNLAPILKDASLKLFASPLKRVAVGAQLLGEACGTQVHFDERLKEHHLGDAVGQSVAWLRENILDDTPSLNARLVNNAESLFELWQRITSFYDDMLKSSEDTLVIYGHGAWLSLFYLVHLKCPSSMVETTLLHGTSGSVSVCHILADGRHSLSRFNDRSYLNTM